MSVAYEKFVRDTYQLLAAQEDVANVAVQHDVKLRGRSGATHQIDVFWQFEIAGQHYQTCVECKYYSSTVKKSHVASFAKVIEDIGNANGIFVSTIGYQTGAKLLARDSHIRLILMVPAPEDVRIDGALLVPNSENIGVNFDRAGCVRVLRAAGLGTFISRSSGGDARLRDSTGRPVDIEDAIEANVGNKAGQVTIDLEGMFLSTEFGGMPLESASVDLSFEKDEQMIVVRYEDAPRAILEDVLKNTASYVGSDGKLKPYQSRSSGH